MLLPSRYVIFKPRRPLPTNRISNRFAVHNWRINPIKPFVPNPNRDPSADCLSQNLAKGRGTRSPGLAPGLRVMRKDAETTRQ